MSETSSLLTEKSVTIKSINTKGKPIVNTDKTNNLSRRDFLKLLGLGIVGAPLVLSEVEKLILSGFSVGLKHPGMTDSLVSGALAVCEKDRTSENPNFRPFVKIISEGIDAYTKQTGSKVIYKRSRDYHSREYYSDIIGNISDRINFPVLPKNMMEEFKDKLPYEAYHAYLQGEYRSTSFEDVYAIGSGFYERFKQKHSDLVMENGYIQDYTKYFEAMRNDAKNELQIIRQAVEQKRASERAPISSSYILEQFLEMNKGDLAASIYDTTIFLKFMARNNIETGAYLSEQSNVQWFQNNIRDEFQGFSFNSPSDDKSGVNLIGKPYHSWNLVSLLQFFPVEMVHASGTYRQMITLKEQGLGKTRADLQTLNDLRGTEHTLLSYT
jgi:hypothetical protein